MDKLELSYLQGYYAGLARASNIAEQLKSGMGAAKAILIFRQKEMAIHEAEGRIKLTMQRELPFESA